MLTLDIYLRKIQVPRLLAKVSALNQTMDILTANPDIVGFYATNKGSTVGVARGIKQKNVVGKVKVVGFDKSKDIINALDEGLIQAIMVQNPYDMGAKGIQSVVDVIGKKTVELYGYQIPRRCLKFLYLSRGVGKKHYK